MKTIILVLVETVDYRSQSRHSLLRLDSSYSSFVGGPVPLLTFSWVWTKCGKHVVSLVPGEFNENSGEERISLPGNSHLNQCLT